MDLTFDSMGIRDFPKALSFSLLIHPVTAWVTGASLGCLVFATLMIISLLLQAKKGQGDRAYNRKLPLSLIYLFTMLSTVLTAWTLCTGKDLFTLNGVLQVNYSCFIAAMVILMSEPNTKYLAVIADSRKRILVIRCTWFLNIVIGITAGYYAVTGSGLKTRHLWGLVLPFPNNDI